eukprot:7686677-Pyramimonas_sp.AAC.1
MWFSLQRRAHSRYKLARASRVEGLRFSKCVSRFIAKHIRLKGLQELHKWRAVVFQNVDLALAPPQSSEGCAT